METIIKKITPREYNFLNKLKDTHIIPKIHKLTRSSVEMEKYPLTLATYIENSNFKNISELGPLTDVIYKSFTFFKRVSRRFTHS
jgi:hypothetical protein